MRTALTYSSLVEKLPEMAKVVNEFKGDSAQAEALRALIGAIVGDDGAAPGERVTAPAGRAVTPPDRAPPMRMDRPATERRNRTVRAQDIRLLEDTFLFQPGRLSVKQFVDEKRPVRQGDLLTVLVYYMQQVAKVPAISLSHVYTALKAVGKKPPGSLRERLKDEKVRYNRLDTSNSDDIRVTRTGIDFVEHDFPPAAVKPTR